MPFINYDFLKNTNSITIKNSKIISTHLIFELSLKKKNLYRLNRELLNRIVRKEYI